MKQPYVAIILVNWNTEEDTIACLESLKKIKYQNYKIFVVDNNSEEESVVKLRSASERYDVTLIENSVNDGFAAGNNVGIDRALKEDFDYFLLLNNDTEVAPDFLDELVLAAEENKKGGLFAPKIYFYDNPKMIWHAVCKFSWIGGGRPLQYKQIDKNPEEREVKKTEYISGCAMLIRRSILEKVGKLSEDFFMYYEDTDFSLATKKAGFELLYVPSSHIWHKVSKSTKKAMTNPLIHYYHVRNALLLSKRQAPKFVLFGIYLWSIAHYMKQILKIVILPSKRESSKMIRRGIKDFYKGKFRKIEA